MRLGEKKREQCEYDDDDDDDDDDKDEDEDEEEAENNIWAGGSKEREGTDMMQRIERETRSKDPSPHRILAQLSQASAEYFLRPYTHNIIYSKGRV